MSEVPREVVFLVCKVTVILACTMAAYALLRYSNPRWQVLTCRLGGCAVLICCVLAMTNMSDAWGPTLTGRVSEATYSAPSVTRTADPLTQTMNRLPPSDKGTSTDKLTELDGIEWVAPLQFDRPSPEQDGQIASTGGTTAVDSRGIDPKTTVRNAGPKAISVAARAWSAPELTDVPSIKSLRAWQLVCKSAMIGWASIAVLLCCLRLLALYQIHVLVQKSVPLPMEFAAACSATSLRPRLSEDVFSPTVVGCWRPVILLPVWMTDSEFCGENLRAACAHEQAHVTNADLAWIHLFEWLSIGLWFHPLLHMVQACHRSACERVADADAATCMGDASAYAASLARVALQVLAKPAAAASVVAMVAMVSPFKRSKVIARRLQWVRTATPARRLGPCRIGFAMVACTLAIGLGTFGISERPLAAAVQDPVTTRGDSQRVDAEKDNDSTLKNQTDSSAPMGLGESVAQPLVAVAQTRQSAIEPAPVGLSEQPVGPRPAVATLFDAIVNAPVAVPQANEPNCLVSASGMVRDETGRPVPGVHVALMASLHRVSKTLQPLNPIIARTITDTQGAFVFQDIVSVADHEFVLSQQRNRSWRMLAVSADGRMGWENVGSDTLPASLAQDIVLAAATEFTGQVVSEDGQPIAGATVHAAFLARAEEYGSGSGAELTTYDHGFYLNELPLTVETDAKGHYRLAGLPVGSAGFATIRHPSIADKKIRFATTGDLLQDGRMWGLHPGLAELKGPGAVIVCEAGTLIQGTVRDQSGQPVEASIALHGACAASTQTKHGAYRLRIPPSSDFVRVLKETTSRPITCTMVVRPDDADSYTWASATSVDGEWQASQNLNFVLRRTYEFSGRVVTSDGQGVPNVGILARARDDSDISGDTTWKPSLAQESDIDTTDAQGNFKIRVPEGQIELLLSGRVPGIDLGQFDDRYGDEDGQLWRWPSDAQPAIKLHAQRDRTQLEALVVRRTEPVNVRVVDPAGQPIAGASVSLHAATGMTGSKKLTANEHELIPIAVPGTTDADGRCQFIPFALPDYTAQFKVISNQAARPMLAKYPLEQILNVTETLRKGVVIRARPALQILGRVTVEGQPLENTWLNVGQMQSRFVDQVDGNGRKSRVLQTTHQGGSPMHVRTGKDGRYEAVVDAAQANWAVSLNGGFPNDYRGFPAIPVQFSDRHHGQVDIDLKRGTHMLQGQVVDQQGQPVAMSRVMIVGTPDFDPSAMFEATQVTTQLDGRFSFIGLPEGSYDVYAESRRGRQSGKSVKSEVTTVTTGETATITLPSLP